jgi:hypothetical protein
MADLLAHERTLLGGLSDRDQQKIARALRELVRPFDLESTDEKQTGR